ncbi:hypothetical protein PUN28_011083 [Cardiocondyla obscurior]|uniref:Uncharacterized protein n=1 Tax=Cardiocondyla obscurior TaxID=286306 RepID=A0AAW2FQ10_9HYME
MIGFSTSLSVVPNESLQYDLLLEADLINRVNLYKSESLTRSRRSRLLVRRNEIFSTALDSERSGTHRSLERRSDDDDDDDYENSGDDRCCSRRRGAHTPAH